MYARDPKIRVAPRSSCHVDVSSTWGSHNSLAFPPVIPAPGRSENPNCKRVLKLGVLRFCNQPFLDIVGGFLESLRHPNMTQEMPSARPNERSAHQMDPSEIGFPIRVVNCTFDRGKEIQLKPVHTHLWISWDLWSLLCALFPGDHKGQEQGSTSCLTNWPLENWREKGNTEVNLWCLCIGNSGFSRGWTTI